jgi:hypothetical protein
MADRYVEHIVVSDGQSCRIVLDNGDTLQGVISLDFPIVDADWLPTVTMRVMMRKERSDDG